METERETKQVPMAQGKPTETQVTPERKDAVIEVPAIRIKIEAQI